VSAWAPERALLDRARAGGQGDAAALRRDAQAALSAALADRDAAADAVDGVTAHARAVLAESALAAIDGDRHGRAALADAAREWIADCLWADLAPEDALSLPDSVALDAVRRHYDGGLRALARDCQPAAPGRTAR
jgi:hypothetical protein